MSPQEIAQILGLLERQGFSARLVSASPVKILLEIPGNEKAQDASENFSIQALLGLTKGA